MDTRCNASGAPPRPWPPSKRTPAPDRLRPASSGSRPPWSSLCCAGQRRHAEHHDTLLLHGRHFNSSPAGLLHLAQTCCSETTAPEQRRRQRHYRPRCWPTTPRRKWTRCWKCPPPPRWIWRSRCPRRQGQGAAVRVWLPVPARPNLE